MTCTCSFTGRPRGTPAPATGGPGPAQATLRAAGVKAVGMQTLPARTSATARTAGALSFSESLLSTRSLQATHKSPPTSLTITSGGRKHGRQRPNARTNDASYELWLEALS